jgi:hypothetical protein
MGNLAPYLDPADRPRALYHGLSAVARETAGSPPRFPIHPLPGAPPDPGTLKAWFRRFIEVRDAEGAERCLATAIQAGQEPCLLAEMLFSAATDHRYLQIGHVVDFTNKAFEALDRTGWQKAGPVLSSLIMGYANAGRMEESNAWRNPVDLVHILENAFERLPGYYEEGRKNRAARPAQDHPGWSMDSELIGVLLGENPHDIAGALLEALCAGLPGEDLASAVSYAAALRIARFHTSNEFGDWDTALHTFTFANAVHQGLRRLSPHSPAPSPSGRGVEEWPLLLRGVFDAAMSVYLDRFLNIPAARLPQPNKVNGSVDALVEDASCHTINPP